LEDDISQLLATHEAIAACVLGAAAESPENMFGRRVSEELISLRNLKERQLRLEQDYELLDTEHQKTEDRLFEKEQDLHYLVVLGPQLPWTADNHGQLLYVDSRRLALVGLSLEQVIGDKWLQIVHPDDEDKARKAWAHSIRTGQALDVEYRIRDVSGSYIWVCSRAVPRHDADRRILKWYGTTENRIVQGEGRPYRPNREAIWAALPSRDGRHFGCISIASGVRADQSAFFRGRALAQLAASV
jgi:PAS domain S-box-containing protein